MTAEPAAGMLFSGSLAGFLRVPRSPGHPGRDTISHTMRTLWPFLAALCAFSGPAAAVTDAERVQVYHEFRAAFDAHSYDKALPLATQLVQMTEEQYGPNDRALVNPLSNLGTTQYRLHDYKSAEQTYLRSVKIVEDSGGGADKLMLRPLHGLGATYLATQQYDEASVALKRALDLSRNLDGLFNAQQVPILDPLITSLVALERHDEAEREFQYSVRVAENVYGRDDLHVLRPLDRYARWLERMGRYTTARVLHAQALSIAEQAAGQQSLLTVGPLTGIARTYRLEFVNGPEEGAPPPTDSFVDSANDYMPSVITTQRVNPDGERAAAMAVQTVEKHQPIDHELLGTTLLELADGYLCGGLTPRALQVYGEAWKQLSAGGSTAPLDAPRQLAYRAPNSSITRSKLNPDNADEHFVEVNFTVTKEGRTVDTVISATDAPDSQQKAVITAIKRARYAPRFADGVPVDTPAVKWRERLMLKKPKNSG
jgi:tetratricopeptide (TPR) repeat protein